MSTSVMGLLLLGFVLGLRHATDADHVVAVNTIVARQKRLRSAALVGALWGIGHSLTILLVGGAIVGLGLVVPPKLGLSMEFGVAIMLVALGVMNLIGAAKHLHEVSAPTKNDASDDKDKCAYLGYLRPLLVGVMHGMAGSAAVALLVLGLVKDVRVALLYLAVFGLGTIVGMVSLTTLVAVPMRALARKHAHVDVWLARLTGLASVGLGLYLAYKIGLVDGLFTP